MDEHGRDQAPPPTRQGFRPEVRTPFDGQWQVLRHDANTARAHRQIHQHVDHDQPIGDPCDRRQCKNPVGVAGQGCLLRLMGRRCLPGEPFEDFLCCFAAGRDQEDVLDTGWPMNVEIDILSDGFGIKDLAARDDQFRFGGTLEQLATRLDEHYFLISDTKLCFPEHGAHNGTALPSLRSDGESGLGRSYELAALSIREFRREGESEHRWLDPLHALRFLSTYWYAAKCYQ